MVLCGGRNWSTRRTTDLGPTTTTWPHADARDWTQATAVTSEGFTPALSRCYHVFIDLRVKLVENYWHICIIYCTPLVFWAMHGKSILAHLSLSVRPSVRCPHSLNIFSSETAGPIKAKFHMEPQWDGGTKKFVQMIRVIWPRWPPCPYMVQNPSKIFSETSRPMTFELGIQHQWLGPYKVCSNDDPGLTLTYFTAKSALLPYAFVNTRFYRNYWSLWIESWYK